MTKVHNLVQSLQDHEKARPSENRSEEIEADTAETGAEDATVSALQGKMLLPFLFC
jgi:hypothetical protein